MSAPCVVGRPLADAKCILAQAGVAEIVVTETAPPRAPRPTGPPRVVRQRAAAHGVSLLVVATVPPPQGEHSHD